MKRIFSIVALSLALLPLTGVARTIGDFFASEPGNIFPLLTRTGRLEVVPDDIVADGKAAPDALSRPSSSIAPAKDIAK